MVFFRWFVGLPLAAIVTAALFAVMAGLIDSPIRTDEAKASPVLDILVKPLPPEGIKPKKPKPLPEAPETKIEPQKRTQLPGGSGVPTPTKGPIKIDGPNIGLKFGGLTIRVSPSYPEACRSRGAEGIVLVEFDVTPEGNVVNARVIDAPDRCFNRIISAISRWKYPPAYENGRPVMRYGVVERFSFQLQD